MVAVEQKVQIAETKLDHSQKTHALLNHHFEFNYSTSKLKIGRNV